METMLEVFPNHMVHVQVGDGLVIAFVQWRSPFDCSLFVPMYTHNLSFLKHLNNEAISQLWRGVFHSQGSNYYVDHLVYLENHFLYLL